MKIREDKLEFDFDDEAWKYLIKFDEHPDYVKVANCALETRGVDFTGILDEDTFVAIEVKDFRGFRTQENNREEPLAIEVAKKMVGTLATISASCRTSINHEILWKSYQKLIRNHQHGRVFVILWKEEDPLPSGQKRLRVKRGVLGEELKKRLTWLGCKTLVTNSAEYDANALKIKVS